MFDQKKTTLYPKPESKLEPVSGFSKSVKDMTILERYAYEKSHETLSGNGAVKLDTTGNIFTDDFGSIGSYKQPRTPQEIFKTVDAEWSQDPGKTLRMAAYIRAISRETSLEGEKSKVIGQGLRHEYFFRLLRIASKDLRNFANNFPVLLALGSEKDLFDLWRIQLEYGENIIPKELFLTIVSALLGRSLSTSKPGMDGLLLKYLPTIRTKKGQSSLRFEANSKIGRAISDFLWPDLDVASRRKAYRQLKSSGNAHTWQQLISKGKFADIDWNKVSGKALTLLTNSKFLSNHGLEDTFKKWVSKQDTIKSTSYPYELVCPCLQGTQVEVANKQFMERVKAAGECRGSLLVAVDVSGSMALFARGANYSAISVAYAMAAFFSKAIDGPFKNAYVTFSRTTRLNFFRDDETPYECVHGHGAERAFGNTDFQSVVEMLCRMRMKYGETYKESEYPSGILCVSDGEFDDCGDASNFTTALYRLRSAGFSEEYVSNFSIVLWDIPNGYYGRNKPSFEALGDTPNFYYMSGFDPSGIAFLTSGVKPKTADELMETALSQEMLMKLEPFSK